VDIVATKYGNIFGRSSGNLRAESRLPATDSASSTGNFVNP